MPSPSFTEVTVAYLESRRLQIQPSTLDALLYKVSRVILPELGQLPAIGITPQIMDDWVNNRLKRVKRVTAWSDVTIIQAVLNWAVRRELITRNPLSGYRKPQRDDAVIQPPTPDEVRAIYRHAPAHLQRALAIAYYTGARPGASEVLRLTWQDVDLVAGTIHIISAKKGGIRSRLVPLHLAFAALLATWKAQDGAVDGPLVCYRGRPVQTLKTAFRTAKRKAKITRRIRLYDLRHAFATAAIESTGDLKAASELIGHTRTDTTTRIYQHTSRQAHRRIVDAIEEL
jgi:integrase